MPRAALRRGKKSNQELDLKSAHTVSLTSLGWEIRFSQEALILLGSHTQRSGSAGGFL